MPRWLLPSSARAVLPYCVCWTGSVRAPPFKPMLPPGGPICSSD
ncbi:hypothetical protein [Massilia eurypsychrophila]|nr:hypothetical protein [Massilia eurypsychrophila]